MWKSPAEIFNGFFRHKNEHFSTWKQWTRRLKSVIDYIIVKRNITPKINYVGAYRNITSTVQERTTAII